MEQNFGELVSDFKNNIAIWKEKCSNLDFIYNKQLDNIDVKKIKYILVADNPGKNEKQHGRYLVGESGVAARCFLKSEFNISDFDSEVLVLNKTPIYSDKTQELIELYNEYEDILIESQEYMSNLLFKIHSIIKCKVFIIGFSNCRNGSGWLVENHNNNRVLPYFFKELINLYSSNKLKKEIYLYKHFSMMQFFRDISNEIGYEKYKDLESEILKLGRKYRKELM